MKEIIYFYTRNSGLQNQAVLYTVTRSMRSPDGARSNTLSADGTVALSGMQVSPDDGGYSPTGSLRRVPTGRRWKVRDVETGKDLSDHLKWVKFSGASWTRDGKGFFYSATANPKASTERVRTIFKGLLPQTRHDTDQDVLVYERPDMKDGCLAACHERRQLSDRHCLPGLRIVRDAHLLQRSESPRCSSC